ncbi:predicted protein [Chaetomium globosum CBS 148.51]|uniref:Uncharacterized protein n=1 Tax=Chaetomium globosum (strain ATCC 6205 / CBS 148.51 / DSM 1962 / NBRC 6347 / NRRL 1970) TaxID=306901 RepID=Q2H7J7_CHAGB|nr:uncharacterized protein CHGG_05368 [Chaetomium globosum CBS 148.51]EAQ88749.1 predicted protein [Chaetomium globosum CBS 148.51]
MTSSSITSLSARGGLLLTRIPNNPVEDRGMNRPAIQVSTFTDLAGRESPGRAAGRLTFADALCIDPRSSESQKHPEEARFDNKNRHLRSNGDYLLAGNTSTEAWLLEDALTVRQKSAAGPETRFRHLHVACSPRSSDKKALATKVTIPALVFAQNPIHPRAALRSEVTESSQVLSTPSPSPRFPRHLFRRWSRCTANPQTAHATGQAGGLSRG